MIKLILILILLLFLPVLTQAAPSCVDAGAIGYHNNAPSDPDNGAGNYTPPGGTGSVTFLGVGNRRGGGTNIYTPTIGGNAMTSVTTSVYTDPAGSQLFWVANLAISAQVVSVDLNSAGLASAVHVWTCTGIDTANPIKSFATTTGTGTTATASPASVASGDMLINFCYKDNAANFTVDASQTTIKLGNDTSESAAASSWKVSTGTSTMLHTLTSEQYACTVAVLNSLATNRFSAPIVMP